MTFKYEDRCPVQQIPRTDEITEKINLIYDTAMELLQKYAIKFPNGLPPVEIKFIPGNRLSVKFVLDCYDSDRANAVFAEVDKARAEEMDDNGTSEIRNC